MCPCPKAPRNTSRSHKNPVRMPIVWISTSPSPLGHCLSRRPDLPGDTHTTTKLSAKTTSRVLSSANANMTGRAAHSGGRTTEQGHSPQLDASPARPAALAHHAVLMLTGRCRLALWSMKSSTATKCRILIPHSPIYISIQLSPMVITLLCLYGFVDFYQYQQNDSNTTLLVLENDSNITLQRPVFQNGPQCCMLQSYHVLFINQLYFVDCISNFFRCPPCMSKFTFASYYRR